MTDTEEMIYAREYWTGDSRDGNLVNGDGYHYFRMLPTGQILEAFEYYELDDGTQVATPLPEMKDVNWINDLGFDDFEVLDMMTAQDFEFVKGLTQTSQK